jgi:FtsH-binding integral membrane protein
MLAYDEPAYDISPLRRAAAPTGEARLRRNEHPAIGTVSTRWMADSRAAPFAVLESRPSVHVSELTMQHVQTLASYTPVAALGTDARSTFIWRTYGHVALAILGFGAIETYLFDSGLAEPLARSMLGFNWLLILGAFMVVGWLATHVAHRTASKPLQYLALAGFVVAEAIIFVPLLAIAMAQAPGVIESATGVTLLGTAGLTAVAFITRKDFSFLRGILVWGGILALVAIVASILFGFQIGTWFSVAMIGFAGAAVLHDTSNVLHHYSEDRYVAAALELFASIALMFWYVLRLFMSRD